MGLEGRISGGGEGKGVPGRKNGRSKGVVAGKSSTPAASSAGWRLGRSWGE